MKVTGFACRSRSAVGVVADFDMVGDAYDRPNYSLVEPPLRADLPCDFLATVFPFVDDKEEGDGKNEQSQYKESNDDELDRNRATG